MDIPTAQEIKQSSNAEIKNDEEFLNHISESIKNWPKGKTSLKIRLQNFEQKLEVTDVSFLHEIKIVDILDKFQLENLTTELKNKGYFTNICLEKLEYDNKIFKISYLYIYLDKNDIKTILDTTEYEAFFTKSVDFYNKYCKNEKQINAYNNFMEKTMNSNALDYPKLIADFIKEFM